MSPVTILSLSPMTNSLAGIFIHSPSLLTHADSESLSAIDSKERSALLSSCQDISPLISNKIDRNPTFIQESFIISTIIPSIISPGIGPQ